MSRYITKKNGARTCMTAKQREMESHTTITILEAHASDNSSSHRCLLLFNTKLPLFFWTNIEYHNWKFRMIYNTFKLYQLAHSVYSETSTSQRRWKKVVFQSFRWSSMHTNGFMANKFNVEWFFQTYFRELLGFYHINILSWACYIFLGY